MQHISKIASATYDAVALISRKSGIRFLLSFAKSQYKKSL
jgi:hypothetical protein